MDLVPYFNKINKLKELNDNEELDIVYKQLKTELQDLTNLKKDKIKSLQQKCEYRLQYKRKKLKKNKQILQDTIKEYSIKEKLYKFPEELIRINEYLNEVNKIAQTLIDKYGLINKKLFDNKKSLTKYYSLLLQNEKKSDLKNHHLFYFEKNIPFFLKDIENNFSDQDKFNSLFLEICSHRVNILNIRLPKKLDELEKEFKKDKIKNQKYIEELQLEKLKYNSKYNLQNLQLENIKLNIDLALQNETHINQNYSTKKQRIIEVLNDEIKSINIFINNWKSKLNINKIKLSLEKHNIKIFFQYLEREIIFFREEINKNKDSIFDIKLEIEKNNDLIEDLKNKIQDKNLLISELKNEKYKLTKETCKKYKYYMNYYTFYIKDMKVINLVLSRDIRKLESLDIEKKYCSNENKKISIYNKLIKIIEDDKS